MRVFAVLMIVAAGTASADPVGITKDMMSVTVETATGPVEISRVQDNAAVIEGDFAQIAARVQAFASSRWCRPRV